ncbi:receptor-type tyrosine-protein phosphatase alpha-like isoform X2 [Acanthaster planci]|uniref:protein-tyrosine-phosphatase n=1 Tax=Acanthaster planci TaxID=133434 RepID=A0A8B8A287_ACAPL|nr:receptor-type tyrosine-protein phosphatase alpha-like isoform X2 [Acanthaster planci]
MSAQSCLRVGSPKPKPRRLHPQPPAERDTNEQLILKLLSQLSSVAVDELAEYICKKEQAGQNGFPADFKTLPDGRPCPATVAKKPQNKTKNFSAEIIAYDHSRVVLEALKNDPHSDYINACYIDGILEKDKYIATQGPTSSTVGDFWRMVWQLKVDKIIMLTNLTEGGEVKCHQYWPDTGFATYLNIAVNVIKEDVFPDYKVRDFQIAQVFSEDKNRVVKQFHFTAWPDLQPPEDPSNLLHFVRKVNAKRNNGGTIVHCRKANIHSSTSISKGHGEKVSPVNSLSQEGVIYSMYDLYLLYSTYAFQFLGSIMCKLKLVRMRQLRLYVRMLVRT